MGARSSKPATRGMEVASKVMEAGGDRAKNSVTANPAPALANAAPALANAAPALANAAPSLANVAPDDAPAEKQPGPRKINKSMLLYKTDMSPPSRAVMMLFDAINVPVHQQNVNLYFGNHRTYEFSQMNPTQKVPVLLDEGHIIWDSHAIMQYAVSEYAPSDCFYPADPKQRSQVDQLLHYDSSVLYPIFKNAAYPLLFHHHKSIAPEVISQIEESYATLENILKNKEYLVLDRLTLADISCAATISTLNVLHPIDYTSYPYLSSWLNKMAAEYFYQNQNQKGLTEFGSIVRSMLSTSHPNITES